MNPFVRDKTSRNPNSGCADLMTMAERELSALFSAVTSCTGQNRRSSLQKTGCTS